MNCPPNGDEDASKPTRVLIVEDEPLIAESLRADLADAGFEVVAVASRIERALALIQDVRFDIAIVDANLAGKSAAPVAAALSARRSPFIAFSGYAREQLQREFSDAIFVQKPYRIGQLIEDLHAALRKRRDAGSGE